jgi:hypothetical protein
MRLATIVSNGTIALLTVLSTVAFAQSPSALQPKSSGVQTEPVPPAFRPQPAKPEPTTPVSQIFHDSRYGVSFTVPAAWNLNRKDAEVSTFALDAPTAARATRMRAVATITFNPHPYSTFSGALFYFSVTPHSSAADCSAQASAPTPRTVAVSQIGGIAFSHGYSEHGGICTESRDEIYTTLRNNTCYRFDGVINNFCGGDVSGVQDITSRELDAVRARLQTILDSIRFDSK